MQGTGEFKTEIELLSRVHHKNLVNLLGFCLDMGEQMLVYEFLPNGSLMDSLTGIPHLEIFAQTVDFVHLHLFLSANRKVLSSYFSSINKNTRQYCRNIISELGYAKIQHLEDKFCCTHYNVRSLNP
ncbi:hypothetical protein Droror1_Dr00008974 [Drosera rotundifolia]